MNGRKGKEAVKEEIEYQVGIGFEGGKGKNTDDEESNPRTCGGHALEVGPSKGWGVVTNRRDLTGSVSDKNKGKKDFNGGIMGQKGNFDRGGQNGNDNYNSFLPLKNRNEPGVGWVKKKKDTKSSVGDVRRKSNF